MKQTPDSRVDRKKEATSRKIIDVSIDLFNQHGLELVTMEQIAETADVAKGTLYNYFSSKEAIINAFLQVTFKDRNETLLKQLPQLQNSRSRMEFVFNLLIDGVKKQKQIFEAFFVYRMKTVISFQPIAKDEETGLTAWIHEIIQLGQTSGELRKDLPEDFLTGLFEYALIAAIKPYYLLPQDYDQAKSIGQSLDLFMNGAKA